MNLADLVVRSLHRSCKSDILVQMEHLLQPNEYIENRSCRRLYYRIEIRYKLAALQYNNFFKND